jgi:hypothetical protein
MIIIQINLGKLEKVHHVRGLSPYAKRTIISK